MKHKSLCEAKCITLSITPSSNILVSSCNIVSSNPVVVQVKQDVHDKLHVPGRRLGDCQSVYQGVYVKGFYLLIHSLELRMLYLCPFSTLQDICSASTSNLQHQVTGNKGLPMSQPACRLQYLCCSLL